MIWEQTEMTLSHLSTVIGDRDLACSINNTNPRVEIDGLCFWRQCSNASSACASFNRRYPGGAAGHSGYLDKVPPGNMGICRFHDCAYLEVDLAMMADAVLIALRMRG